MNKPGRRPPLLLAFYGDDLTGSTDALEALTLAGVRSILFMDPPSRRDLADCPGIEAVGVAGLTRALRPAAMEKVLVPAFRALRALKPRYVHYKVCSTFDSSPKLGSIGRAIAVGARVFGGKFVPVVGGAPALGRYCVFGHLFARMGIGSEGSIHRLDRHPSMRRHQATPATESDLRIMLSRQAGARMGLVDFTQLGLPFRPDRHADAILFDALTDGHVERIGEILRALGGPGRVLFAVGPSSVEIALVGTRRGGPRCPSAHRADGPILVGSGSGSLVTRQQIAWARRHGFAEVAAGPGSAASASRHLAAGRNVVVHARGNYPGPQFGAELGRLLLRVLEEAKPSRVVVAGGDSSGHVARELGVHSLRMIARLTPGAPLCRLRAPGSPADGCEFVFKGGQVGGVDYFGTVASGASPL